MISTNTRSTNTHSLPGRVADEVSNSRVRPREVRVPERHDHTPAGFDRDDTAQKAKKREQHPITTRGAVREEEEAEALPRNAADDEGKKPLPKRGWLKTTSRLLLF